jgi:hypothetical protein
VFEVFDMNTELEHAILENKSEDDIYTIARQHGMLTMKEDAIIKSVQGTVPFEEVNTLGGEFELPEDDTIAKVGEAAPPVEIDEDASPTLPGPVKEIQV